MRLLIGLALMVTSTSAFAARQVLELDANGYKAATASPAKMDSAKLYYTQKVIPFSEWGKQ